MAGDFCIHILYITNRQKDSIIGVLPDRVHGHLRVGATVTRGAGVQVGTAAPAEDHCSLCCRDHAREGHRSMGVRARVHGAGDRVRAPDAEDRGSAGASAKAH